MTAQLLWVFARGTAFGIMGGTVFFWLGLPLPWVMGAMVATILSGVVGLRCYMPRSLRNAVVPALGVMLGAAIDREALGYLPELWLLGLIILGYLMVVITAGCIWFMRFAGLDLPTAYFASVPGSFSEMIFIAQERNADLGAIAVVHSIRQVISLTLITIGFRALLNVDTTQLQRAVTEAPSITDLAILTGCAVVGFVGGRAIRLPNAHLFGPLILSSITHMTGIVEGAPPAWTVALAQVFIGIFVGIRFENIRLGAVRRLAALSIVWSIFLVFVAVMMGAATMLALDLPFETAFLSFAPGGSVEIAVIAVAAGLSLSVVTIIQFIRMALTILLAPLVFRWISRQQDI